MKSKLVKSIYGIALVLALASAIILPATRYVKAQTQEALEEQPNSESEARKLEGTWRVQVTIRDCQTGVEIRRFRSLLTFAHGGTTLETTSAASPALRGPGHGIWRHTGGHTYTNMFEAFTFNPAGAWTGTQRVVQNIEIGPDPDEYNSNGSNEIFDTNGSVLVTGCNTAVGRRLE